MFHYLRMKTSTGRHARVRACVRACVRVCVCARMCNCVGACMHACARVCSYADVGSIDGHRRKQLRLPMQGLV